MKNKTIIYVGPFSFPDGGAAARRILGVSKSLLELGCQVQIASGQESKSHGQSITFEGLEVFSLGERTAEHLPRHLKHMAYLTMGKKTISWLDSLPTKPYALILYSGYSPYLLQLIPWSRRNNVKLIFDAVEWYDPPTPWAWISPYQINIELAMRNLIPRVDHVFSISTFLHEHFSAKGCESLLMPPTLDVQALDTRVDDSKESDYIKLVYAGSPGKKDLLDRILEAVFRLREAGFSIHLSVAGVSSIQASTYSSIRGRSSPDVTAGVTFLGSLSHDESIALVRQADFSLLLRNNARYAKAGFPTKVVESMALGTPVIANLTSDLNQYLTDDETGFICSGASVEDMQNAIARALALSGEQHAQMRRRCRDVALSAFDYRVFAKPIEHFLQL